MFRKYKELWKRVNTGAKSSTASSDDGSSRPRKRRKRDVANELVAVLQVGREVVEFIDNEQLEVSGPSVKEEITISEVRDTPTDEEVAEIADIEDKDTKTIIVEPATSPYEEQPTTSKTITREIKKSILDKEPSPARSIKKSTKQVAIKKITSLFEGKYSKRKQKQKI